MGGIGSGRRDQDGKATTSDKRSLDIRRLQRDGLLIPGRSFGLTWTSHGEKVASIQIWVESGYMVFRYNSQSNGSDWQPKEYSVYVEWTVCNFGGRRAWFLCPSQGCGCRVAILYAGSIFACRHCNKLAYVCQREALDNRAARRADTIRRRLCWEEGILNGEGGKPKGMHWRTYDRLKAEHNVYVRTSISEMEMRFRSINHELDGLGIDLEALFRGN